jgi:hypothetical protein
MVETGFYEVRRRALQPEGEGNDKAGNSGPENIRFQAVRVAYFVSFPLYPSPIFLNHANRFLLLVGL